MKTIKNIIIALLLTTAILISLSSCLTAVNVAGENGTPNVYYNANNRKDILNFIIHGPFDVAPYMLWGNTLNDSTTIIDRIKMAFK